MGKLFLSTFCITLLLSSPLLATEKESNINSFFKIEEKEKEPLLDGHFTKTDLTVAKIYSEILHEKTTKDDVVIFLGRSPYIYYYFWKTHYKDRNYFSVSFSGQPYSTDKNFIEAGESCENGKPSDEKLIAYKKYLNSIGLVSSLEELKKTGSGRVVLVDFTITASGMINFVTILQALELLDKSSTILFAAVASFYEQKAMENEEYATRKALKNRQFPFITEFFPFSTLTMGMKIGGNEAPVGGGVIDWEFSIPGLGYFPCSRWAEVDPKDFKETGDIDVVTKTADKVWKELE